MIAFAGVPTIADACSVPVFRYALDNWLPDTFRIRILHQGPLADEDAAIVEQLREQAAAQFSNVTVEEIDINDADDPAVVARYEASDSGGAPLCVVQAPSEVSGEFRDVWSGTVTEENAGSLLTSPVREQLVKQLLAGTSVVWLYLESGEKEVDNANYELLETELSRLEGELELPEIDAADLDELSTSPEDLKLKFSALRLSRDNPDEKLLVETLLSSEPDLRDEMFVNKPMAFPVFGRGRVLYSLVDKGITAGLIEDACRFLTGACQCTVKAQNPGTDLLVSVDWDGHISPTQPTELDVTLTGLAAFQGDSSTDNNPESPPVSETATVASDSEPQPDADVQATPAVADETAIEPLAAEPIVETPAAESVVADAVARPPEDSAASWISPGVLIVILGLLVVVGSFFLIPRH